MQAPVCIHQSAQPVHGTIHRVARAMASLMGIGHHVDFRLVPQLRQHLVHRGGPGLRCTPLLKLIHQASKLLRGGGAVNVPHPAVQFAGLAAAVPNLQDPCRKQSTTVIRGNNVWNAFRVDAQPSVLTVWGRSRLSVPRFGREHAVGFLEMDVIGSGRQRDAQNAAAANGCRM